MNQILSKMSRIRLGLCFLLQLFLLSVLYVSFVQIPSQPRIPQLELSSPDHEKHGHVLLTDEEEKDIDQLTIDWNVKKLPLKQEAKKWIVITSINPPTEAVKFLANMQGKDIHQFNFYNAIFGESV